MKSLIGRRLASLAAVLVISTFTFGCTQSDSTHGTVVVETHQSVSKRELPEHHLHAVTTVAAMQGIQGTSAQQVMHGKPGDMFTNQVAILEYHDSEYIPNDPYAMAPQQFAGEMKFLYDNHFHAITLDQLYDAMYLGGQLPTRPIVISFDDGYESNYTSAYPVLKRYGLKACVFVVSNFVNRRGFMTRQQLLEMQNSGVFQIESHTADHRNLLKLSSAQVTRQLEESRAALTRLTGRPVVYFCYPYGAYNGRTIGLVRAAGYLMATTTDQGYIRWIDGPYRLNRLTIYEGLPLQSFARIFRHSIWSNAS